mmetsp:Transcript_58656/g.71749  ORF Transcript_58656/g.71749 Transcript_58656/m.71749 type:complete len:108 (-) Transcript_58656:12-335(-)
MVLQAVVEHLLVAQGTLLRERFKRPGAWRGYFRPGQAPAGEVGRPLLLQGIHDGHLLVRMPFPEKVQLAKDGTSYLVICIDAGSDALVTSWASNIPISIGHGPSDPT